MSEEDKKFLEFVKKVIAIRKGQLVIQRKEFFKGEILEDGALPNDIIWLSREGRLMEDSDWTNAESRIVGVMLEGATMHETDVVRGTKGMQAKTLLLLCNTAHVGAPFFLPEHALGDSWKVLLDTSEKIFRASLENGNGTSTKGTQRSSSGTSRLQIRQCRFELRLDCLILRE